MQFGTFAAIGAVQLLFAPWCRFPLELLHLQVSPVFGKSLQEMLLVHFVVCPHFKMLTLQDVNLLLPEGFYTVSLVLSDRYWHVPIAPAKRPYLGFSYLGTDYWFWALPFGLNTAPGCSPSW